MCVFRLENGKIESSSKEEKEMGKTKPAVRSIKTERQSPSAPIPVKALADTPITAVAQEAIIIDKVGWSISKFTREKLWCKNWKLDKFEFDMFQRGFFLNETLGKVTLNQPSILWKLGCS